MVILERRRKTDIAAGLGNRETAKKNRHLVGKQGRGARATEVFNYAFDHDESEDSSSSGNRV